MYFLVLYVFINSFNPAVSNQVYFKISQPDFYTRKECRDTLQEFETDFHLWLRSYEKSGYSYGECYKIKGLHKA